MNVHITMFHERVEQFKAQWPMATVVKVGRYYTTYALPKKLYEKVYLHVMEYGSIDAPACINYVKITGIMGDQPLKLFIKEKDCNKVLERLVKAHNDKQLTYPAQPFHVTMKKVRIERHRRNSVEHIVLKSMTAIGFAA